MIGKMNLPYNMDIINDILRYSIIRPLTVIDQNIKETVLGGYVFPANPNIIANLYLSSYDLKYI